MELMKILGLRSKDLKPKIFVSSIQIKPKIFVSSIQVLYRLSLRFS